MTGKENRLEEDPLWYKDAIIYEVHVRSFYDSNGDGIGDFIGLTEKLDYLKDLGITAIWILPFYPSPLKDDGYDISDYLGIHPNFGTLKEFKNFLKEAHDRGIRVITELILNHTSDQHPWFKRARAAPQGSKWRDFYVWSDTPKKYKDTNIIFEDFESSNWAWDPTQMAYYWHRFYSHQPDLNYNNPHVEKAILKVIDYWFNMGIDGMRLDAVPYLFEREGTNCENLPETYEFLKKLRAHVNAKYKNKMLLAEANQWPEDAVAYFGNDDICHMAFHFPLMPRIFMALRMEDRFPIFDILEQTPQIPESCQWALFLRNHDELTLSRVTDEEREYMFRMYAHDSVGRVNHGICRRLAPLLGNHRRRIELMKSLLLSLPGTPVIYYGDEIGMGDNTYLGDRNGVRTPMQWSADKNAGFSHANPQKLFLPVIVDPEYHYEAVNVEAQQNNPHSLLWWMKRLISLRKHFKAFGRGTMEFLYPENRKVIAFIRRYQDECILVISNLSRFVQYVELDLSAFKGRTPIELFSRTEIPPIGDKPYFITMGPHDFYWFSLELKQVCELRIPKIVSIDVADESMFFEETRTELESILAAYLQASCWSGKKARTIKSASLLEVVPVPYNSSLFYMTMIYIEYIDGSPETFNLPLTIAFGEKASYVQDKVPQSIISRVNVKGKEGVFCDASADRDFCHALVDAISHRRRFKGKNGENIASPTRALRKLLSPTEILPEPEILKGDYSNILIAFGDKLVLKFFRHIEEGQNPDLEIGRFLTERKSFAHIPQVAGALEYYGNNGEPATLAILTGYVPDQRNAWQYTLDALGRYFEIALAKQGAEIPLIHKSLIDMVDEDIPIQIQEMMNSYIETARLLGQRTAQLHIELASYPDNPNFAPQAFSSLYQRSIYHSMQGMTKQVFALLRKQMNCLPEAVRKDAQQVLNLEGEILKRFKSILDIEITAMRIRCHGDYHLGQVLRTGNDFVIIDFEGETEKALSERKLKRSPFKDVAGMIRSFQYAAYELYLNRTSLRPEDIPVLEPWSDLWYTYAGVAFLKSYLDTAKEEIFIPKNREEIKVLLNVFLLEKAVYELDYELNNRPEWVIIPLKGIKRLI